MPKLHIMYIPGLGDHKIAGQRRAIALWRLHCVTAEVFQMNWADSETWERKFAHLLERIDELTTNGVRVGLVGASAGASAAINAFAVRQDTVAGVVLISGKVNHAETVGQEVRSKNPSFWTSIQACEHSLSQLGSNERRRIQSRYAFKDMVVTATDSYVQGADNRVQPSVGHVTTIGTQIIFAAPLIIKFLKKQAEHID